MGFNRALISALLLPLAPLGSGCLAVEITWDADADGSSKVTQPFLIPPGGAEPVLATVLGQMDFTSLKALKRGMYSPEAVASDGVHLAVADSANHRVLLWTVAPTSSSTPPDLVLGQPGFTTNFPGLTATGFNNPTGVALGPAGQLLVADASNHRVLVWNSFPTAHATPPNFVIGQVNFTSNATGTTAITLSNPRDVATDGTRIAVADTNNHRVLIWNAWPTMNQPPATTVFGQANMTTATPGSAGAAGLSGTVNPRGVSIGAGRLAIADYGNNRVLLFNAVPSAAVAGAADAVLGQASTTANSFNTSSLLVNSPHGACFGADGRVYTVDGDAHRIYFWNSVPGSGALTTPDGVLGQASPTAAVPGSAAGSLNVPLRMACGSDGIWVADRGNHRIQHWPASAATGAPGDGVLGQPGWNPGGSNNPGAGVGLHNNPTGAHSDGKRLVIADRYYNRVLVWNSIPTAPDTLPDLVLGQANLTTYTTNAYGAGDARSLNNPSSAFIDGDRLVVADTNNHRVVIWNAWPTANGQAADLVVGQTGWSLVSVNNGSTVSAQGLNTPQGAAVVGGRLLVADTGNHRVLIWTVVPAANGVPANRVLGQASMTVNLTNDVARGDNGMNYPVGVCGEGDRLFAVDSLSHRVLGWNSFPGTDGAPADLAFGQPNFTLNGLNYPSAAQGLSSPKGCQMRAGQLAVADQMNHRVLVWKSAAAGFVPPDLVVGQPTAASVVANGGFGSAALAQGAFNAPAAASFDDRRLFVLDPNNSRLQILPRPW